jgi:hypothetical protein
LKNSISIQKTQDHMAHSVHPLFDLYETRAHDRCRGSISTHHGGRWRTTLRPHGGHSRARSDLTCQPGAHTRLTRGRACAWGGRGAGDGCVARRCNSSCGCGPRCGRRAWAGSCRRTSSSPCTWTASVRGVSRVRRRPAAAHNHWAKAVRLELLPAASAASCSPTSCVQLSSARNAAEQHLPLPPTHPSPSPERCETCSSAKVLCGCLKPPFCFLASSAGSPRFPQHLLPRPPSIILVASLASLFVAESG